METGHVQPEPLVQMRLHHRSSLFLAAVLLSAQDSDFHFMPRLEVRPIPHQELQGLKGLLGASRTSVLDAFNIYNDLNLSIYHSYYYYYIIYIFLIL